MSLQTPESGLGMCLVPEGWRDRFYKASQVRARSDGLSCPSNNPRSPPYRDFDASCKTSRLRARKRITP